MAEALLRDGMDTRGLDIEVASAGLGAMDGKSADPLAVKLMQERGINIADFRSAQFSSEAGLQSDLILVMSKEMRDSVVDDYPPLHGRVYRLGHWGNYDIADPYMRGEVAFRKALKLIESGVVEWFERIV
ncbi:MAG: arsenate reductase/protein-tyrosine-phosphatase family protein [Gammaproteobacteria bacterium]